MNNAVRARLAGCCVSPPGESAVRGEPEGNFSAVGRGKFSSPRHSRAAKKARPLTPQMILHCLHTLLASTSPLTVSRWTLHVHGANDHPHTLLAPPRPQSTVTAHAHDERPTALTRKLRFGWNTGHTTSLTVHPVGHSLGKGKQGSPHSTPNSQHVVAPPLTAE